MRFGDNLALRGMFIAGSWPFLFLSTAWWVFVGERLGQLNSADFILSVFTFFIDVFIITANVVIYRQQLRLTEENKAIMLGIETMLELNVARLKQQQADIEGLKEAFDEHHRRVDSDAPRGSSSEALG